jgi:hypothetical protein
MLKDVKPFMRVVGDGGFMCERGGVLRDDGLAAICTTMDRTMNQSIELEAQGSNRCINDCVHSGFVHRRSAHIQQSSRS